MVARARRKNQRWQFRAERLTKMRREINLSLPGLAERIATYPDCENTSKSHVSKWECRVVRPDIPVLFALEDIFGVPTREWFDLAVIPDLDGIDR
jgi:transcriptional regulator with XRE-family HTH domain